MSHGASVAIHGTDAFALVALSVVVVIGAAYATLEGAVRAKASGPVARVAWLLAAAAALELGILGMHFLAVPTFHLPLQVQVNPWLIALSAISAIAAAALAAYFMSQTALRSRLLAPAALGMGTALICMHEVAMSAMSVTGKYRYHPRLLGSSVGMVIVSALAVVWLTYRLRHSVATARSHSLKSASAVIIGLGIASAHYMEMAASPFSASGMSHPEPLDMPSLMAVLGGAVLVAIVIIAWSMYVNHRLTVGAELSRLAAIVESSNDAIISTNRDGLIRTWNAGAERLYGYTADEVKGRHASILTVTEASEEVQRLIARVIAGEVVQNFETVRRCRDGTMLDVSINLSSLRARDGRMIGISTSTRDITERRKNEMAMREAQRAAESATRTKSEFLANMSHEIRTPMNGVLGMLDLALDTSLQPEQRDYIATARTSADALLTLINDILDFSKIEAGKMSLEVRPFALRTVIAEFIRPLEVRATQKGLRLVVDIGAGVPEMVFGDSARLRQVLINLLGNAIKFTSRGEVGLVVEVDATVPSSTVEAPLRFVIRDTGIGISPDKQLAIFEAFVQEDASTTREHGGTGLGLAIAARLVALMDGRISVESEPGQGSAFFLSLPFRRAPGMTDDTVPGVGKSATAPVVPAPVPPTTPPLRILLADDNAVNQKFLRALLTKRQHAVTIAGTGHEVLAHMARESFDLILMDVQMPELGGFEATALIRAMEVGTGRHIPIIAVTARAIVGDRERCLEAGMDDYLSKPIHLGALYDALARWAPPNGASSLVKPRPIVAVERETLLMLVDGDEGLLAELVDLFAAEAPRLLREIRTAVASQDARGLRDAAHALKGSSSSMAATGVTAVASVLEQMADDGALEYVPGILIELEEELQRSLEALNSMIGTNLS